MTRLDGTGVKGTKTPSTAAALPPGQRDSPVGDPPHLAKLAIVLMPAEIDNTNADRVGDELAAALTPGAWAVIADMTATTFCDPAAITMLVSAHLRATASNAELRLVTRSGAVLRALAIAMVDYSLPVYPTVAAALIPRPARPALPPATLHPGLRTP